MSVRPFPRRREAGTLRFELLPDAAASSVLALLEEGDAPSLSDGLQGAVLRAVEAVGAYDAARARERLAVLRLFAQLVRQPVAERRATLADHPRLRSTELCELLMDESLERAEEDPAGACNLAELALEAARLLDPALVGPRVQRDLTAEAWAVLANGRRARGDLGAAAAAVDQARALLPRGSGSPLVWSTVALHAAAVARDRGRLDDAFRAAEAAVAGLQAGARSGPVASALVLKGSLQLRREDPGAALDTLAEAAAVLLDSADAAEALAGPRRCLGRLLDRLAGSPAAWGRPLACRAATLRRSLDRMARGHRRRPR